MYQQTWYKRKVVPDAIDAYTPILNLYHKDHWYYNFNHNQLYIHYPELVIKNSLGQRNSITDLIIQIPINASYLLPGEFFGFRLSYTEEELRKGYIHSHSHSSTYYFDSYCVGDNNNWSKYLQTLNVSRFITPAEFGLFLSQLKDYLSWESLEGTPYVSIKTLNNNTFQETIDTGIPIPTGVQGNAWEHFIHKSTLHLVNKYSDLLQIHGYGWILKPRLNPAVALQFEVECVTEFLSVDLRSFTANYSKENSGYIISSEDENSTTNYNTIRTIMTDTITAHNLQPFLDKLGFKDVKFPIINKSKTDVAAIPTVKRLSTTVGIEFITSINRKLLNGLKP